MKSSLYLEPNGRFLVALPLASRNPEEAFRSGCGKALSIFAADLYRYRQKGSQPNQSERYGSRV